MRCLALAERLLERGAAIRFVCREHPGNLMDLVRSRGIPVAPLQDSGLAEQEDAAQTIEALKGVQPDWMIVDHYGIGAAWEDALHAHAKRVLVVDDLANRRHDCEALLDQNYTHDGSEAYERLVSKQCRQFLGPRHALLRPEYAAYRKASAGRRDGQMRRVLVFLGGSDPHNVTGLALDALSDARFGHLEVDVVVGANNVHRGALEKQASERPRTSLHGIRPHLADLMTRAHLAIGAGGATTWERLCLGLPSLVVSIADNQVRPCQALAADSLIRYLGTREDIEAADIGAALEDCLRRPERLAEQAIAGQAAVDGLGAARIAEFLDPTHSGALILRPAEPEDLHLYLDWVNDPEVRRQSLRSESITLPQHRQWFAGKLAASQSLLFVMEARGLPVGQIRFDCDAGETKIDYSIERPFRGRGWARQLVTLGLKEMRRRGPATFRADVKESNLQSMAVFQCLAFAESASPTDARIRVYRLDSRTQG